MSDVLYLLFMQGLSLLFFGGWIITLQLRIQKLEDSQKEAQQGEKQP